jgi:UCH-binding domain
VLKPDFMVSALKEDGMLESLAEYLPEQHRNREGLEDLARSAQLRQQMNALSSALMNGQLDLSHFGLRSRVFLLSRVQNFSVCGKWACNVLAFKASSVPASPALMASVVQMQIRRALKMTGL